MTRLGEAEVRQYEEFRERQAKATEPIDLVECDLADRAMRRPFEAYARALEQVAWAHQRPMLVVATVAIAARWWARGGGRGEPGLATSLASLLLDVGDRIVKEIDPEEAPRLARDVAAAELLVPSEIGLCQFEQLGKPCGEPLSFGALQRAAIEILWEVGEHTGPPRTNADGDVRGDLARDLRGFAERLGIALPDLIAGIQVAGLALGGRATTWERS